MSVSSGGGKGANSDINVTPLVDVCLVLLIIFMVMVPQNVREISVRVPPESRMKNKQHKAEEPLVIGLSKEGAITLNRKQMDKTKLAAEITRQLSFREKKVVFVDFHDEAKYGDAVALLELAKGAGSEVLGIMKKKGRKIPDTLDSPKKKRAQ
ncbi:MAG: biopolymer transporter ExbD [Nannocystaceae bacterium]|nr:biopolymer transporter ExbD [Nannocystaceae bacterium]